MGSPAQSILVLLLVCSVQGGTPKSHRMICTSNGLHTKLAAVKGSPPVTFLNLAQSPGSLVAGSTGLMNRTTDDLNRIHEGTVGLWGCCPASGE